ncbi:hypothetical protein AMECASPLE_006799 [Ameca splendens]|uniref:Uncharacterized protein n=1 Tax=Ameca splendens TaxID=208324 RepID=A0ABV0YAJ2_9TELE
MFPLTLCYHGDATVSFCNTGCPLEKEEKFSYHFPPVLCVCVLSNCMHNDSPAFQWKRFGNNLYGQNDPAIDLMGLSIFFLFVLQWGFLRLSAIIIFPPVGSDPVLCSYSKLHIY